MGLGVAAISAGGGKVIAQHPGFDAEKLMMGLLLSSNQYRLRLYYVFDWGHTRIDPHTTAHAMCFIIYFFDHISKNALKYNTEMLEEIIVKMITFFGIKY